jgi:hypothetical protein
MKEFKAITDEILLLEKQWESKFLSLPPKLLNERKNNQNRTVKQILGHLIDSTSNNIHRIIHLQYQASPLVFPNYASEGNNDRWISIQDYQGEEWPDIVNLWKYSVFHICHVISNVDDKKLKNEWIAGPDRLISLESLIIDYLRHFKLHLSEIEELIQSQI